VTDNMKQIPDADSLITQLGSDLSDLEQQRLALRERTRSQLMAMAAGAVIAAIILAMMLSADNQGLAALLVVAAVIGGVVMLLRRQGQWKALVFERVMPIICDGHEQLQYKQRVGNAEAFIKPYEKLSLFGRSTSRKLEHYLTGTHRGRQFEVISAQLSRKSGGKNSGSSSVFDGLLFRIQMPVELPARIIIRPRGLFFSRIPDMVNVTIGNEEFDERFLVSHEESDPEGEARAHRVLTPAMQQVLLTISAEEGGLVNNRGAISAGLIYDSLYLTLTRANVGQAGKIKFEKPKQFLDAGFFFRANSDLEKAVREMLHDVGIVYRIIDRLQQAESATPDSPADKLWR